MAAYLWSLDKAELPQLQVWRCMLLCHGLAVGGAPQLPCHPVLPQGDLGVRGHKRRPQPGAGGGGILSRLQVSPEGLIFTAHAAWFLGSLTEHAVTHSCVARVLAPPVRGTRFMLGHTFPELMNQPVAALLTRQPLRCTNSRGSGLLHACLSQA